MPSQQHPIGTGFGPASSVADVIAGVDLSGQVAIVTGGYSGLGLLTAQALASAGAEVVVPARDAARAKAALGSIEVGTLDLMDSTSIDAFADSFLATGRPLHLLVNSAGIMATPLAHDSRGNESQFSTNHLGHFQLTRRLWPALARAQGSRVVSVSSRGHQIAPVDFDDLNFKRRPYDKWVAYGQSKTANALFAVALDARGASEGIRAFSLHPGTIVGPLARHLSQEEIDAFGAYDEHGERVVDPARDLKTPEQGAATSVWCATSPALAGMGGLYCEDSDIAVIYAADADSRAGVNPWAIDATAADRLWTHSESLLKLG